MNPTLDAAKAAISNLSPNQAPTAAPVNTAMSPAISPQGIQVPQGTGAPTQVSAVAPELNALFAAQNQNAPLQLADQQRAGNAATAISNYYNSQQNAYYNSIQQANAASQAAANYKQVKSPDGGYNFFDNTGKPIPAWKYAQVQNKDVTQVLAGSNNPVDQQYINDHKTMDDLMSAWQSGNKANMDKVATNVGFKSTGDMTKAMQAAGINTPADLNTAFMSAYPNIWGNGQGTSAGNLRTLPSYGAQPSTASTFFSGG